MSWYSNDELRKFDDISIDVLKERERQNKKWNRKPSEWNTQSTTKLAVLLEEVGEVARGILEKDPENVKKELIQVAAVCFAWLEAWTDADTKEISGQERFDRPA